MTRTVAFGEPGDELDGLRLGDRRRSPGDVDHIDSYDRLLTDIMAAANAALAAWGKPSSEPGVISINIFFKSGDVHAILGGSDNTLMLTDDENIVDASIPMGSEEVWTIQNPGDPLQILRLHRGRLVDTILACFNVRVAFADSQVYR